ncbi:putative zinc transporter 1 [Scophthalmus maximus]|uniref:Putative zinc transporter 1 n=1 Tax=Scophthalmus maximus TaxID=52904 RepID=A0A2U9CU53_SCOMX|nr:zinc transporter 1a [Scophthalmus maximus]AWP20185.1 putative zinc transporter 1 [Scophthalmus maximus]QQX29066.1 solute carrier family 30 member 1a [Scophthalmus maximus]
MACEPNRVRLLCMLSLTFGFFIVEVVVSRITSSLAMLSDSFHMLSDVIALVVALVAVRFAEKTHSTNKNTFGWVRAEVMGALVNAVFLTALCFTILLEVIERITEPHEIESPMVVIAVGAAGLLVNLLGLCLFHGHAGGGHGHSHGGHGHGGKSKRGAGSQGEETNLVANHSSPGDVRLRNEISCKEGTEVQMNGNTHFEEMDHDHDHDSSSQLNMRGVFLHVLGDALGSVIVVVNAVIFVFVWQPCKEGEDCYNPCVHNHGLTDQHVNQTLSSMKSAGPCWVLYMDPVLCIIMVTILLYTTYPLLKESALILLQTVPKQINMRRLNERLLSVDGVLAIHELHIWQLAGSRIIATAHIKCQDPTSYMEVAKRIKDFFHNEGIHATTIQPEFVTFSSESRESLCELSCRTQCAPKLCCGSADKPNASSDKKSGSDYKPGVASDLEVISESAEQALGIQVSPRSEAEVIVTREVESSL